MQYELDFPVIHRDVEGETIDQRSTDGYFNATAMCKVSGKKLGHYLENKTTKEFLAELSTDIGIPISELVIIHKGGVSGSLGTWVHPDIAVNLAQWLSPKFAVKVAKWVREWMSGESKPASSKLPYHLERYMENRGKVPHTHFSILGELTICLVAPLEDAGYTIPDTMVPDISEGRMFAKWLRDEKGIDTNALPTYRHRYPDGRVVDAKMYPIEVLADFRKHFNEVWLPQKAVSYFKERDPKALSHMPKMLN